MLVKVNGKDTETVARALTKQIRRLPAELRKSLTWDRGMEMATHKEFAVATDVQVYFCDPQSPWQRGTNENTNRLLRQYFPKGTDLSARSQADLCRVALRLNQRPRKTLDFRSPADVLNDGVASTDRTQGRSIQDLALHLKRLDPLAQLRELLALGRRQRPCGPPARIDLGLLGPTTHGGLREIQLTRDGPDALPALADQLDDLRLVLIRKRSTLPSPDVSPTYVHNLPGTWVAELLVTDDWGQQDQTTILITVTEPTNAPSVASPTATPTTGTAPLTVQFMANASDPDGDPLTHSWDFGDPISPGNGSSLPNPQHTFIMDGTYSMWLTVSDGQASVAEMLTIVVGPTPGRSSACRCASPRSRPRAGTARWARSR
jgi:hypothetical protein